MMQTSVFTMEQIAAAVKPLADKYRVKEIYLFGSYARGEADENSDLDFLVFGGEMFRRTMILPWRRSCARCSRKTWMFLKSQRSTRTVISIKRL